MSWNGAWWGRDGPRGVFPLGATPARHPEPGKLHRLAAGEPDEVPLLFFRPAPYWIAVYDPLTGTARAYCEAVSPADIVKAVAACLGYEASLVRRDVALPSSLRLAGP